MTWLPYFNCKAAWVIGWMVMEPPFAWMVSAGAIAWSEAASANAKTEDHINRALRDIGLLLGNTEREVRDDSFGGQRVFYSTLCAIRAGQGCGQYRMADLVRSATRIAYRLDAVVVLRGIAFPKTSIVPR